MSRHLNRKTKPRFRRGKKPPQFLKLVALILRDSTLSLEEIMADSPTREEENGRFKLKYDQVPEGTIVIKGVGGAWLFSRERLARHWDALLKIREEFSDEFYGAQTLADNDFPTVADLQYDRKGRTWAPSVHLALALSYLFVAAGLAEFPVPYERWKPETFPFLKFLNNPKPLEIVNEPSQPIEPSASSTPPEPSDPSPGGRSGRDDRDPRDGALELG